MSDVKLWGDAKIEIIGGQGENGSGKSVFGLEIADGIGSTLAYDFEGSLSAYQSLYTFDLVDVTEELHKAFPRRAGCIVSWTPLQLIEWWIADMQSRALPGKYDVIMVDPIATIEQALPEYVRAHPKEFGLTQGQVEKALALLWGASNSLERFLLHLIRSRCQTFYFTQHMKTRYIGNVATSQREARGKEPLMEASSLVLEFSRAADEDGKQPAAPAAIVRKHRLMGRLANGEKVPLLPPRLPVATPAEIRKYIAHPPRRLSAGERMPEEKMSDDDRLALQAAISDNNEKAATAELSKVELMRRAALTNAGMESEVDAPTISEETVNAAEQLAVAAAHELAAPARKTVKATGQPVNKSDITAALSSENQQAEVKKYTMKLVEYDSLSVQDVSKLIVQFGSSTRATKLAEMGYAECNELIKFLAGRVLECEAKEAF